MKRRDQVLGKHNEALALPIFEPGPCGVQDSGDLASGKSRQPAGNAGAASLVNWQQSKS